VAARSSRRLRSPTNPGRRRAAKAREYQRQGPRRRPICTPQPQRLNSANRTNWDRKCRKPALRPLLTTEQGLPFPTTSTVTSRLDWDRSIRLPARVAMRSQESAGISTFVTRETSGRSFSPHTPLGRIARLERWRSLGLIAGVDGRRARRNPVPAARAPIGDCNRGPLA
jgi:hypothetical protein